MKFPSQIVLPVRKHGDFIQADMDDGLNALPSAGGSYFALAQNAKCLRARADEQRKLLQDLRVHAGDFQEPRYVGKISARLAIRNNRLREVAIHPRKAGEHTQTRGVDVDES